MSGVNGVDQILADERGGSVVWALADNQGTIRDLVDGNGTILNHINYDSFGKVVSQSNTSVEFRYGYTGREQDSETGLDYYRARYYDASNGRFISEDPIGFSAGDANLTRYVGNSPVNGIDPSGLEEISLPQITPLDVLIFLGAGLEALSREGFNRASRGGFLDAGKTSDGTLPSWVKQKVRGNLNDANPNYSAGSRPIPLLNAPSHTGNTDRPSIFDPNNFAKHPPQPIPQQHHTGGKSRCLNDILIPPFVSVDQEGLIGNLDNLSPSEREFVERKLSQGKQVEIVPTAADRTPDFIIDGQRIELKTISGVKNQTSDGISKAISSRVMDGRGQAVNIYVDATKQPGVTEEIAIRGINRSFGADNRSGGKIESITVEGPGFSVTSQRK